MIMPALSTRSIPVAPIPRSAPFYQRLVFRALGELGRGQLQLTLPDGSRHLLGGRSEVHWHETTRSPAARAIPSAASIEVRHAAFFKKCVLFGDIGFAESYLDGDWETPDISAVIAWFLLNRETAPTLSGSMARGFSLNLLRAANRLRHLFRSNNRRTAARNIR